LVLKFEGGGNWYQVSGIRYQVSSIRLASPLAGIRYQVSGLPRLWRVSGLARYLRVFVVW